MAGGALGWGQFQGLALLMLALFAGTAASFALVREPFRAHDAANLKSMAIIGAFAAAARAISLLLPATGKVAGIARVVFASIEALLTAAILIAVLGVLSQAPIWRREGTTELVIRWVAAMVALSMSWFVAKLPSSITAGYILVISSAGQLIGGLAALRRVPAAAERPHSRSEPRSGAQVTIGGRFIRIAFSAAGAILGLLMLWSP